MSGRFQQYPATVVLTILCVVCFLAPRWGTGSSRDVFEPEISPKKSGESKPGGWRIMDYLSIPWLAHDRWSPPSRLMFVLKSSEGSVESAHPGLDGPFQLWQGEWWRVPLSAFHHENFLHLACNLIGMFSLLPLLERRWGFLATLLFMTCGGVVSMCAEYLIDHHAIGFSGAVCSAFGALIVLRKRDDAVALLLPDRMVVLIMISLLLGFPLTELGILNIANLAHFAGLGYGWVVAEVMASSTWPVLKWSCLASHVAIGLAVMGCVYPVWNSRYHWYQAEKLLANQDLDGDRLSDSERAERIGHLLRAWGLSHEKPWLAQELVRDLSCTQDWPRAWAISVEVLAAHPTDPSVQQLARHMWRRSVIEIGADRRGQILREQFGEHSAGWSRRLAATAAPQLSSDLPDPDSTISGRTKSRDRTGRIILSPDLLVPGPLTSSARDRLEIPAEEGVLW